MESNSWEKSNADYSHGAVGGGNMVLESVLG